MGRSGSLKTGLVATRSMLSSGAGSTASPARSSFTDLTAAGGEVAAGICASVLTSGMSAVFEGLLAGVSPSSTAVIGCFGGDAASSGGFADTDPARGLMATVYDDLRLFSSCLDAPAELHASASRSQYFVPAGNAYGFVDRFYARARVRDCAQRYLLMCTP